LIARAKARFASAPRAKIEAAIAERQRTRDAAWLALVKTLHHFAVSFACVARIRLGTVVIKP
jgi:hypothetical protein